MAPSLGCSRSPATAARKLRPSRCSSFAACCARNRTKRQQGTWSMRLRCSNARLRLPTRSGAHCLEADEAIEQQRAGSGGVARRALQVSGVPARQADELQELAASARGGKRAVGGEAAAGVGRSARFDRLQQQSAAPAQSDEEQELARLLATVANDEDQAHGQSSGAAAREAADRLTSDRPPTCGTRPLEPGGACAGTVAAGRDSRTRRLRSRALASTPAGRGSDNAKTGSGRRECSAGRHERARHATHLGAKGARPEP